MEYRGKTLVSAEALAEEAGAFAQALVPRADGAALVTLSGELGAGKTTFVQAIAKELGVKEHVTSPTFVLAKAYQLPAGSPFSRLVHVDAYRLKGGDELPATGLLEYLKDPGTLVLLEWPEMVADTLPPAQAAIRLETQPDRSRTIAYA